jgi:hypothetical protein
MRDARSSCAPADVVIPTKADFPSSAVCWRGSVRERHHRDWQTILPAQRWVERAKAFLPQGDLQRVFAAGFWRPEPDGNASLFSGG